MLCAPMKSKGKKVSVLNLWYPYIATQNLRNYKQSFWNQRVSRPRQGYELVFFLRGVHQRQNIIQNKHQLKTAKRTANPFISKWFQPRTSTYSQINNHVIFYITFADFQSILLKKLAHAGKRFPLIVSQIYYNIARCLKK